MFIIYDLIFLAISITYLPVYLLRGKFHRGFMARLGFLPKNLNLGRPIWVHAVSVGEAQSVRVLIEGLRKAYPAKKIVISTVTATGNKIAKTIAKAGDFITYLPFDFGFSVKCSIDKINPAVFILAETEIWPNLISYLSKKKIPIAVVNGRISDASFKGYSFINFLSGRILNKVSIFCAQGQRDAERLRALGVMGDKIKVTGNMKFDIEITPDRPCVEYKDKLALAPQDKLFVAGSTHAPEEEIILEAYQQLRREFKGLRLLIAPRHPERAGEIAGLVSQAGLRPVLSSELPLKPCHCLTPAVFIVDSIGELNNFYAVSDIVFVGGSLAKKGGHNILEPAVLGKPVLFGPHMSNFRDIAELFLMHQAGVLVRNAGELEGKAREILSGPSLGLKLSQSAKELIAANKGSSRKNLEFISSLLAG